MCARVSLSLSLYVCMRVCGSRSVRLNKPVNGILGNGKEFQFGSHRPETINIETTHSPAPLPLPLSFSLSLSHLETLCDTNREKYKKLLATSVASSSSLLLPPLPSLPPPLSCFLDQLGEHHTIGRFLVLECNKIFIFCCFVRFDTSFIVGLLIVCRRSTRTHTHARTHKYTTVHTDASKTSL